MILRNLWRNVNFLGYSNQDIKLLDLPQVRGVGRGGASADPAAHVRYSSSF